MSDYFLSLEHLLNHLNGVYYLSPRFFCHHPLRPLLTTLKNPVSYWLNYVKKKTDRKKPKGIYENINSGLFWLMRF